MTLWPAAAAAGIAVLALTIAHAVTPVPGAAQCVEDEAREKIQKLMIDGLDEALKAHIKKMFEIWVQDDTDQPKRAINGMKSGLRAYIRSRAAALHWNPPAC